MIELGKVLGRLREQVKLSQTELGSRVSSTASRISRIESGEISVSNEEAAKISQEIGSRQAMGFSKFLLASWKELTEPGFTNPNLEALVEAEEVLRELRKVKEDPNAKNAFVRQIDSCGDEIRRLADFLRSTDHDIALIGAPGVGKTTALCALADLRRKMNGDLKREMVLQTGGGRTTICEVQVKGGDSYSITLEPWSDDDIRKFVGEFCESLLQTPAGNPSPNDDENAESGLSAEIRRAIRNMSNLVEKRSKTPDGALLRQDPAKELAARYPVKEDLVSQLLLRLELPKRTKVHLTHPGDGSTEPLAWMERAFGEINYGRNTECPLPKRIYITIPEALLSCPDLALALIDTRGVDESPAFRSDLQHFIDNPRSLVVLCSSFKGAPDAVARQMLERGQQGGMTASLAERVLVLVLPQNDEERSVRDEATGELVETVEDGREIKADQILQKIRQGPIKGVRSEFFDVRNESDTKRVAGAMVAAIAATRSAAEIRLRDLFRTVRGLIENRADEEARLTFEQATKDLILWLNGNLQIEPRMEAAGKTLIELFAETRYASSIRASVNRNGDWENFHYWYALGFGARCETVKVVSERLKELQAILGAKLRDKDLVSCHSYLEHFGNQVNSLTEEISQEVQTLAESAFREPLVAENEYWSNCRRRWGLGSGYKDEIRIWTKDLLEKETSLGRATFVLKEVQRLWASKVNRLEEALQFDPGTDKSEVK